jgi:ethanolamine ammonia-lyase large subunit
LDEEIGVCCDDAKQNSFQTMSMLGATAANFIKARPCLNSGPMRLCSSTKFRTTAKLRLIFTYRPTRTFRPKSLHFEISFAQAASAVA